MASEPNFLCMCLRSVNIKKKEFSAIYNQLLKFSNKKKRYLKMIEFNKLLMNINNIQNNKTPYKYNIVMTSKPPLNISNDITMHLNKMENELNKIKEDDEEKKDQLYRRLSIIKKVINFLSEKPHKVTNQKYPSIYFYVYLEYKKDVEKIASQIMRSKIFKEILSQFIKRKVIFKGYVCSQLEIKEKSKILGIGLPLPIRLEKENRVKIGKPIITSIGVNFQDSKIGISNVNFREEGKSVLLRIRSDYFSTITSNIIHLNLNLVTKYIELITRGNNIEGT